jgi:hypothetical protein
MTDFGEPFGAEDSPTNRFLGWSDLLDMGLAILDFDQERMTQQSPVTMAKILHGKGYVILHQNCILNSV